ncbi:azaleucine resistance protein AzlC [Paracraurococcus ruber]|uniref:Azaleucine resistance protein AzlC n=2 Tax=Paracraurococcus ruber TaxID=77675 RepID=A0ABS1D4C9_9PROT|nr:AzlC family ABC transporter permease [Paracraurococcus ruber]MBK1661460.1 azaleucine resistance protein AzlC [Paracraurococcus ruber]TDG21658.1 azaleucine resistance protein AzlC [Paracraurococcus ruber]
MAITLGLSPFGLVVGMTSDQVGLSLLETLLMSGLVFAGTSQLVALQLWSDPAPVLGATLACLVINLRLLPMGAALAPVLDRTRGLRLWGTLALLVDNAFALAIAELRAGRRDVGFLFGAGFGMWLNWMAMCAVGHLFGNALRLPAAHPVFFASTAAVLAILVQLWRGRADLQPWILAGAVALAVQGAGLGAPWPVLAGAFAGAGFGAWRDGRRQA